MSNNNVDTERAILLAAEQEFMAKGFAGARTTAIAQRAGVSHTMLHYYYRTKESLFDKILEEKAQLLIDQVLSLFQQESGGDVADRICQVAERHFDLLTENPLLPGFVLGEFKNDPARLEKFFAKIRGSFPPVLVRFFTELEEAAGRGEIRETDGLALITDILAMNVGSVTFADVIPGIFGLDREDYLRMRKRENLELLKLRLKP